MKVFTDDEAIAWPSYVDFLSAFSFVLILFVGYMVFLVSNGMRDLRFLTEVEGAGDAIQGVSVDYDNRRVTINLNEKIRFANNCPRAVGCPTDLSAEQKEWLYQIGRAAGRQFPGAARIVLQGQADHKATADKYGNFELAHQRAMLVYRYYDELTDPDAHLQAFRQKLQIANVGDKLAEGGDDPAARTVVMIVDYEGST